MENETITTKPIVTFSDEWLEWAAGQSKDIGARNSAHYFAMLPTVELRVKAHRQAIYLMNVSGGNYSGCVAMAAGDILRGR